MQTLLTRRIRATSWATLLSLLLLNAPYSQPAKLQIPNVSLEITARQKEDGKLGEGFHIFKLLCWSQECSLSIITFDSCRSVGFPKPTSMIKEEQWSNTDGTLEVLPIRNSLQVSLKSFDIGGQGTTTLRFGYPPKSNELMAMEVTSFSGGFVKNSEILKRVITVEYVPMVGTVGTFAVVDLGCPLAVPALKSIR